MKKYFDIFKPPFRYDGQGQMVFDSNNNVVLNIRGWGRIQREPDAEQIQDGFGLLLADTLNKLAEVEE